MKRAFMKLAATAALVLPIAGQTADLDYSFVGLDYMDVEVDSADADGFALRGSLAVHPNVFVFAQFADLEFDRGVDGEAWNIGAGGHWPLNDAWDLVGKLGIVKQEVGRFDEDGALLSGGVRGKLTPQLDLDAGLEYADLKEPFDELTVFAESRYNFTNQLSAGLLVRFGDDVQAFGISGRFSF
jgi:hypothetical protein